MNATNINIPKVYAIATYLRQGVPWRVVVYSVCVCVWGGDTHTKDVQKVERRGHRDRGSLDTTNANSTHSHTHTHTHTYTHTRTHTHTHCTTVPRPHTHTTYTMKRYDHRIDKKWQRFVS